MNRTLKSERRSIARSSSYELKLTLSAATVVLDIARSSVPCLVYRLPTLGRSPRPTMCQSKSRWMSSTVTTQDLLLRKETLAGILIHQQILKVTMTVEIPEGMTTDEAVVVVVVVTIRINLEVISLAISRVVAQMILMMVTKVVTVDYLEMDLVARPGMDLVVLLAAAQALLVTMAMVMVTTETRMEKAGSRPISLALD